MLKCTRCGRDAESADAKFCSSCGGQLAPAHTGSVAALSRGSGTCPRCGVLLPSPRPPRCPSCDSALPTTETWRPETVTGQPLLARIPDGLITPLGAVGGVALTAVLISVIAGVARPGGFLERMFLPGGVLNSIPWAISVLFFWSAVTLLIRSSRLRMQRSFLTSFVLTEVQKRLDGGDAAAALDVLRAERVDSRSILLRRVQRALEQWQASGNLEAVDSSLRHHAELDSDVTASGYALVRIFVWAMPVLGLIGTVIGISLAVGGFSKFLGGEISNIEVVKKQLVNVTSGLSFAFLITLNGLLAALLVMLPTAGVQKAEEDFLAEVDRHSVETVLPKLHGGGPVAPQTALSVDIGARLAEMLEKRLPALDAWQAETDKFAQAALQKVAEGYNRLGAELGERATSQHAQMRDLAQRIGEAFVSAGAHLVEQLDACRGAFSAETEKTAAGLTEVTGTMRDLLREHNERLERTARELASFARQIEQVGANQASLNVSLSQLQAGDSLNKALTGVQEALVSLHPLLSRLSGPLSIQLVPQATGGNPESQRQGP